LIQYIGFILKTIHYLRSISYRLVPESYSIPDFKWLVAIMMTHSYSSWMALQPLLALASLQFPDLIYSQSAGLLEWVISSSQGLYRNFGREMADNFAQRPPWG
jgi:hypothetical protein